MIKLLTAMLNANLGNRLTHEVILGMLAQLEHQEPAAYLQDQLELPDRQFGEYRIYPERLRDSDQELVDLLRAFWEEAWQNPGTQEFDLQIPTLLELERTGQLVQLVVRHGPELVGCANAFVSPCLFTGRQEAQEFVLYLKPEHRKGALAATLLEQSLTVLRQLGVQELTATVLNQANTPALLRRKKFQPTATVFTKPLEGSQA